MKETILHIAGHYLQVEAGERLAANYDPFRAVSVADGEAVICRITCGEHVTGCMRQPTGAGW